MDTFGECAIDRARRLVTRNGLPVHLSPKAYDLLALLFEERPRVVTKAELIEALWPRTYVVEANLSNLVAEIRAALGDSAREPRWIRTAFNVGYGFLTTTRQVAFPVQEAEQQLSCWLVYERGIFDLQQGDHLIGRHPASVVPVRSMTVSRTHARLTVSAGRAVLCDLGSRNGTLVSRRAVEGPTVLRDRDTIVVGDCTLEFRAADLRHPTDELRVTPVAPGDRLPVGNTAAEIQATRADEDTR